MASPMPSTWVSVIGAPTICSPTGRSAPRPWIGSEMPRLAADFDRLDANRDGKLSREEIRAGRGQRGGMHDGEVR